MFLPNHKIDEHIAKRDLIAISRGGLDSNKLQGFPLSYSPNLLLLRYVYDFHLDGLLLIRRSDITDYHFRETDRFQRKLLETENRLKGSLFRSNQPIDCFTSFLTDLPPDRIVIIENETPANSDFYIGRVLSSDDNIITMHEFSGAGNWERESTEIACSEITCCQTETNYINFYSRHFKRTSQ